MQSKQSMMQGLSFNATKHSKLAQQPSAAIYFILTSSSAVDRAVSPSLCADT